MVKQYSFFNSLLQMEAPELAGSEGPVGTSCQGKQQHVEAHEDGQAERMAAVVVPEGRGQRARLAPVSLGSWRR